jgi:hypothetical protein
MLRLEITTISYYFKNSEEARLGCGNAAHVHDQRQLALGLNLYVIDTSNRIRAGFKGDAVDLV